MLCGPLVEAARWAPRHLFHSRGHFFGLIDERGPRSKCALGKPGASECLSELNSGLVDWLFFPEQRAVQDVSDNADLFDLRQCGGPAQHICCLVVSVLGQCLDRGGGDIVLVDQ